MAAAAVSLASLEVAMRILRYILLIASLVAVAFIIYVLATEHHTKAVERLVALGIAAGLVLNFVYVLRCPPHHHESKSRLAKLGGLWLDAKERELRDRAGNAWRVGH